MEKMRAILKLLMDKAGDNPYSVQTKARVPQSTTFRFIRGISNDPKTSTVRKWANLYHVTESQLRGIEPIDGINVPEEPKELKDILPADEYNLLKKIKSLNPEAKGVVIGLFDLLDHKSDPANSCSSGTDRRQSVISEKNQHRRNSDKLHYSPPTQHRIKEQEIATRTGTRA